MGGTAVDLLPGDAELARRAAGGDGAAFVRLYDRYSAEVFEASLIATAEAEAAAGATQFAFLRLLRRPPAMGAPDREVAERLRGIALASIAEAAPGGRPSADAADVAPRAVVGWLRSETVANAGARFDADWSLHLSTQTPPRPRVRERIASERPAFGVAPAQPTAPRRRRPRWLALPAAAASSRPRWRRRGSRDRASSGEDALLAA